MTSLQAGDHAPFSIVAALAAFVTTTSAHAECLPIEKFAQQLLAQFREVPVARAIQSGHPVIYFANIQTGTFTVVMLAPPMACPIASGTSWLAAEAPPHRGSPL